MRKIFLLFLYLSALLPAFSQQRISVAAGVHQSSVSPFWPLQPGASGQHMQSKSGFHLGIIADFPLGELSDWYFQPGVVYMNKGAKQKQVFDTSQTKLSFYQYSQSVNYIDIPMNLVFKFPSASNSRFIIGGGPFASLFYSGNISSTFMDTLGNLSLEVNRDLPTGKGDHQFRGLHWGLNLLAGVEFGKAYLTTNFNKGLTSYFLQGNNQLKHASLGITFGVFVGRPKEEDREVRDGIFGCPSWW